MAVPLIGTNGDIISIVLVLVLVVLLCWDLTLAYRVTRTGAPVERNPLWDASHAVSMTACSVAGKLARRLRFLQLSCDLCHGFQSFEGQIPILQLIGTLILPALILVTPRTWYVQIAHLVPGK